jgi:hypothetical protein
VENASDISLALSWYASFRGEDQSDVGLWADDIINGMSEA